MKTLLVTVERGSDGFTLYTSNEIFSGVGDTLDAARKDMEQQIALYVEVMREDGKPYPAYLDGGYEIKYKFEVSSLLEFYEGVLGLTALEKLTGVGRAQLWKYRHGTKPRKAQIEKIEKGLHRLGAELCAVSL